MAETPIVLAPVQPTVAQGVGAILKSRLLGPGGLGWTLAGIGVAVADPIVTYLTTATIPSWAHMLVGIASLGLLWAKSKVPAVKL